MIGMTLAIMNINFRSRGKVGHTFFLGKLLVLESRSSLPIDDTVSPDESLSGWKSNETGYTGIKELVKNLGRERSSRQNQRRWLPYCPNANNLYC